MQSQVGWEREKEMKISTLPHEQVYKDDMLKQVTPQGFGML